MTRRKDDHGLHGVVFATALFLALILCYFGIRRIVSSRPPAPVEPPPKVELARPSRKMSESHSAPSRIPPMRLLRIEGKPRGGLPPAVPMPKITPDEESR